MAEHEQAPQGPDLRRGVLATEVPDGGMIAGHVDGEAVLLVHRGVEWFAVGATCSHYSGPLPEGLVIGDTVRCPGTTPASVCAPGRRSGRPRSTIFRPGRSSSETAEWSSALAAPPRPSRVGPGRRNGW
jgi:Ferredoxin subunits of nitrite reductase and ring-hydroxylating dioxygenases